jgi:hypothetical protein
LPPLSPARSFGPPSPECPTYLWACCLQENRTAQLRRGTITAVFRYFRNLWQEAAMNGIIYLIGLIVVILAILSFFGLR